MVSCRIETITNRLLSPHFLMVSLLMRGGRLDYKKQRSP